MTVAMTAHAREGRRAIVIGGGARIGRAIVLALPRRARGWP
jgi:NAD(P)-dependent dehydrogenase (short-subunit alcohol dehydrogenase family)